ncbi:MAG: CHAT domain-containing protein, partial [Candidatus Omnitrophica bacterium]|nr:CHAT domain-containing protein [Candidatus Omnitrophota bacterium]
MSEAGQALVLEILKQEEALSMSVFESSQPASTIRHYSRISVPFHEISSICSEITSVLNKANKYGPCGPDLILDLKKSGQLLWDHLLTATAKNKLKNTPKCELILFLDEELINIPWELIYDSQEFLCLKFNLGRLVRSREQPTPVKYRGINTALKMLVLANPTNDLKSAYLEGLGIKNQFERKAKEIKIDFKSTSIDKLYVKKNLRDYDIVHFAGHCEYDENNPEDTGWVLSDGRFNTRDIITIGQSLSLPSLVFSNSC